MFLYGFNLLADVYRNQQKFADAERLYRDSLDGHRASLGAKHTSTLIIQNRLATLLAELARHDEAIPLFEELVEYRIDSIGPDAVLTLRTIARLTDSLRGAGRCAEAVDWVEKSLPAPIEGRQRRWVRNILATFAEPETASDDEPRAASSLPGGQVC